VVRYIAKRTGDGWTVAFGRLNEQGDKFSPVTKQFREFLRKHDWSFSARCGSEIPDFRGGLTRIEKRQMHKTIIEFSMKENVEAGFHTAVMDQIPEDTDVSHVLTRKPSVPQWIATKLSVYRIETDVRIRYLMTMDAFRKLKQ
jgi:hypothetical protein